MSFRTIVIENPATIKYSAGYLIIRQNEIKKIHISEIDTLLLESTNITLSTYLIKELLANKVCIIMCDEMHNPHSQINLLNGSYDNYKKIEDQLKWDESTKQYLWKMIVEKKIENQALYLRKLDNISSFKILEQYSKNVLIHDNTNREGLAAKTYFNSLFGKDFKREEEISINWALDYGYSLILAWFNRTIVSKGYLTQLGIKHVGKTNPYNLSCDLMEPFRPIVDYIVKTNIFTDLDTYEKRKLLEIFNYKIYIDGKQQYVTYAIDIYLTSIFNCLNDNNFDKIVFPVLSYEW